MKNLNYRKSALKVDGIESVCSGSDAEGDMLLVEHTGDTKAQGISVTICQDVSKDSAIRLLEKMILWLKDDASELVVELKQPHTKPLIETPKTH
jgi:hypothetical protein